MKFILLITLLAIAFSSNGDVTALSLSATFYNTTGKAADALCGLTVSATVGTALATSLTVSSPLWLFNSMTQNSVAVNDSMIFINNVYTVEVSGGGDVPARNLNERRALDTFTLGTPTAAFYAASSAFTLSSSVTVTSSNVAAVGTLAVGAGTISSAGTSWAL